MKNWKGIASVVCIWVGFALVFLWGVQPTPEVEAGSPCGSGGVDYCAAETGDYDECVECIENWYEGCAIQHVTQGKSTCQHINCTLCYGEPYICPGQCPYCYREYC